MDAESHEDKGERAFTRKSMKIPLLHPTIPLIPAFHIIRQRTAVEWSGYDTMKSNSKLDGLTLTSDF